MRMPLPLFLFVLVLAVISAWGWLGPNSNSVTQLPTYSTIPIEQASGFIDQNPYFAISPDGRTIAYCHSEKGIILQSLSSFAVKVLPGTEGADHVTFSPDQQSLAFFKEGRIYKIGITGVPITLVGLTSMGGGILWGLDDYIYYSGGLGSAGIWRVVSSGGGKSEQITQVYDSLKENGHVWPQLLSDKKTLLFTALGASGGHEDSRVMIENIDTHQRIVLVEKAMFGSVLSNGNLIYATNDGSVFTVPFDVETLTFKGQPVTILSGVTTGTWGGAAFLAVSRTGNLVYLPRNNRPLFVLEVLDRSGKSISEETLNKTILSGKVGHGWGNPVLSPAGDYLAITGRSYGVHDIWLLNTHSWEADRITFDIAEDEFPVWSPDGRAIAFTSAETGTSRRLFIKTLNGGSNSLLIGTWPRHIHFSSWSPDGKWLAGYDFTADGMDCWIVSVDGKKSIAVATTHANENYLKFSPDGRWLAFQSVESGRPEIYVMSFPSMENKRQVSVDGGTQPVWDSSGKFIYYLKDGFMIAHPVEIDNEFKKGKPQRLFATAASEFAVSPDGGKFYVKRLNSEKDYQPLHLVTNWFQEFGK
ncbi:MAG: hypothetical protein WD824_20655 [Cyclobacteriaceae bacterium]